MICDGEHSLHDYSKFILPLTELTKKGQSFVWTKEADTAFEGLKKEFTLAPVLAHVNPQKPFIKRFSQVDSTS